MRNRAVAVLLLLAVLAGGASPAARATQRRGRSQEQLHVAEQARVAEQVRAEFLHAWRGYERYAWGHDALRPLSKAPHDWYKETLLMTPVDALDTMILMGLKEEAEKTKQLIVERLSFDKDVSVKNFEVTIRLLGGLLSGYQLTGDRRLLALAEDLGTRLLPAFESPTGIPYMYVNLKTGAVRQPITNPAEAGTLLIEFGTLSKLTGKPVFYQKAKRSLVEVYKRRSTIGLVGQRINVETGEWTNRNSSISAEIDSYYEYLLKCWLLFGDEDCRRMWRTHIRAINRHLADDTPNALWYGHADMDTGRRAATTYGALDAFFPAVLALSGDLRRARRLQESSFKMWQLHGVEPEELDYRTMQVKDAGYALRPEIVESAYYLHRLTGDPKYLRMGETMFADFVKACRTEAGYASLKSVVTKEKADVMESFVLAETFKYFYLLHASPRVLNFRQVVFNTEAHPIRKTWVNAPPKTKRRQA
ncbi:MAG: degradation enhancer, mannosidase alpha-like 2 [Pyrinomonadaceae bacterium]|jgi:mannosidase alpha-like ER degradation enhancer 2|nr:degradation enhancer, mannosidase alpha-like 2 [Pyrinomonadaceae bacterium]